MNANPKILSLCLMAVLLFSAAAVLSSQETAADPDPVPGEHADHDGWTAINQAYIDTNGLPTDAGNYYLTTSITLSTGFGWTTSGAVTLCLNGFDITTTAQITVKGDVTITDCSDTVRYGNWVDDEFTLSDAHLSTNDVEILGGILRSSDSSKAAIYVVSSEGTNVLRLSNMNVVGSVYAHGACKRDTHDIVASLYLYNTTVTGSSNSNGAVYTFNNGGDQTTPNSDAKAQLYVYDSTVALNRTHGILISGEYSTNNFSYYAEGVVHNTLVRDNTATGNGGGISFNRRAIIEECTVENNTATGNGGGIYVSYANENLARITDTVVQNNIATGNGGGIYVNGGNSFPITSVEIYENTAANGGGLGILGGTISLQYCEIHDNHAQEGGGVYCSNSNSGSIVNITDCSISDNSATGKYGGLVFTNNTMTVNISGETAIMDNSSGSSEVPNAGGIFADQNCTLNISGYLLVTDNTAVNGSSEEIDSNLCTRSNLTIVDALKIGNKKSNIGLSFVLSGDTTAKKPTTGWGANNGGSDYTEFFFSDNPGMELTTVEVNGNDEIACRILDNEALTITYGSGQLSYGDTSTKTVYNITSAGYSSLLSYYKTTGFSFLQKIGNDYVALEDINANMNTQSGAKAEFSIKAGTHAGTYTVRVVFVTPIELDNQGSMRTAVHCEQDIELTVNTIPAPFTAPTNANNVCILQDGIPVEQPLINAAVYNPSICTVKYSSDGNSWSTDLPQGTAPGSYNVYYKALGFGDYHDTEPVMIVCTISKITAQWPNSIEVNYNGNEQSDTLSDTAVYTVTQHASGTNVGNYNGTLTLRDTSIYKWADSDDAEKTDVLLTIEKAVISMGSNEHILTICEQGLVSDITLDSLFGGEVPAGAVISNTPAHVSGDFFVYLQKIDSYTLEYGLNDYFYSLDDELTETYGFAIESDNYHYDVTIDFSSYRTAYFSPVVPDYPWFFTIDDPGLDAYLNDNVFVDMGAEFAGWYTDPVFGDLLEDVNDADPDTDYYARWILDGNQIVTGSLDLSSMETFEIGTALSWNSSTKVLALNGLCMYCCFMTGNNPYAILLPDGSAVVAENGTVNTVWSLSGTILWAEGDLTLRGNGTLNLLGESDNTGIYMANDDHVLWVQQLTVNIVAVMGICGTDMQNQGITASISSGTVGITVQESRGMDEAGFFCLAGLTVGAEASISICGENDPHGYGIGYVSTVTVNGSVSITNMSGAIDSRSLTVTSSGSLDISDCMDAIGLNNGSLAVHGSLTATGCMNGISCDTLTMDGELLRVESQGQAISANVSVTIESGTVILTSDEDCTMYADSLSITGGNISVTDSYQQDDVGAIYVSGEFEMTGGTLSVYSKGMGIYSERNMRLSGCTVYVESVYAGLLIEGETLLTSSTLDMTVISAMAESMTGGSIIIRNGTINLESSQSLAIGAGTLQITGGTVNLTGKGAIWVDTMVQSGGFVTCVNHDDNAACAAITIESQAPNGLTVSGGTLYITTASKLGIVCEYSGNATISNCVVTVSFETPYEWNDAIDAYVISIIDASVTVKGQGALFADNSLIIGEDDDYASYSNTGYYDNTEIIPLTTGTQIHQIPNEAVYTYDPSSDMRIFFHAHNWSFEADNDTITGTCSNQDGCPENNSATVKISAPAGDLYADGVTEFRATLSRISIDGVADFDIVYQYKLTAGGNYEPAADLTKAGFYRASVTIGGATACVEYKVYKETGINIVAGDTVYNGQAHAAQATILSPINGADGTLVYTYAGVGSPSTEAPVRAGTYVVTVSTPGDSIYALTGTVTAEFTIDKKQVTITGVDAEDKVYDKTLTATPTGDMVINGKVGDDVVIIVVGTARFTANANVGTNKEVVFEGFSLDGADAGNYELQNQPVAALADITPKTLTLSGIAASNKEYDGNDVAVVIDHGQLIGVIDGDVVEYNRGSAAFSDKKVGTGKTVTFSGFTLSGAQSTNYVLTQPAEVTADITALRLDIADVEIENKIYDGGTAATIAGTPALIGVVDGDTVELVTSGATAVFTSSAVDENIAVTVTGYKITGADAGNYELIQPAGLTADITAKALTLTGVTSQDKVYDGTYDAEIVSYGQLDGVVDGDTVIITAGTARFLDKNASANNTVRFENFGIGGASASNYVLAAQPSDATYAITRAVLTITGLSAQNRAYDGTTNVTILGNAQIEGLVGQETVTLTDGSATFDSKDVGTRTATFSEYSIGGNTAVNYELTQPASVTAKISPKPVLIAGLLSGEKTYDGTNIAPMTGDPVVSDKVGDDEVDFEWGTATFADENVGNEKVVIFRGFSLIGKDKDNYVLDSQPTNRLGSIVPLHVHIEGINAANKVYDGDVFADITGKAVVNGFLALDDVSLDTANARAMFADKDVGSRKTVTFEGYVLTGSDAPNYFLDPVSPVRADITVRDVTITGISASDKTYDGTPAATPTGDATIIGKAPNDDLSVIAGTAAFADKNVGTGKTVSFTGYALDGNDKDNYRLTGQPTAVTADITAKDVTITGLSVRSKTYDGTADATVTGNAVLEGLVPGDNVSITAGTASFADKNAQSNKPASFTGFGLAGTDAGNYNLTGQPADVVSAIEARPVTITGLTASDKVYNGSVGVNVVTDNAVLEGMIPGDNLSFVVGAGLMDDKNVGVGKTVTFAGFALSGDDVRNYNLTGQPVSVTVNVTPREVSISGITAESKIYDGTADATFTGTAVPSTIHVNDDLSVTVGTAAFADKNVGTGKTVTFAGFALAGNDKDNYTLIGQPAQQQADITAKNVTITGLSAGNKVYDGNADAIVTGNAVLEGLAPGDNVSITAGTAAFADKNVGTGKTVTFTGFALAGNDKDNYNLIGQPADVAADIAMKDVTITGLTAQSKTYNGDANAGVNTIHAVIDGMVEGDDLSFFIGAALFYDKNVGTGKTVTFTGYRLIGTDAGNYQLTAQPAPVTADITIKPVTITGLGADNKVYDGTASATINGTAVLDGKVNGDSLSVSAGSATFDDKNVGAGKTVTFAGFALAGNDAGNYLLTGQPAQQTADITAKGVTITGLSAEDKVYDGTTTATVNGNAVIEGMISGDNLTVTVGTAAFADKNVGDGKNVTFSGYALAGNDAGNYLLTGQPADTSADITAKAVTITGLAAQSKTYNGDANAGVNGIHAAIDGKIEGDNLSYFIGMAVFSDKNVGLGKTVTFYGFYLQGNDAKNYNLTEQPAAVTADIVAKAVTITGLSAEDKVYDGTATAKISGNAALDGKINSDDLSVSVGSAVFDDKNVGAGKTVTFSGFSLAGNDAGNYQLTGQPADVTANISVATLTATYVSEKIGCMDAPAFTVTVTGFVDNESEAIPGFVKPTVSITPVIGVWELTPSGGSAPNYMFNYVAGILTVEHVTKPLTEHTASGITYYSCDSDNGCGKSFLDEEGTVEYTPTTGNEVIVNKEISGSAISDADAQKVLDLVTDAKTASPDTEIQAEFTTVDSDSLSVSADVVKQIAESDIPVVLKTQALDVEAPAELLQSIGNSGNLTVSGSVTTDVPEEMKKYIGDNTVVVDVSLSVNGQAWTQFGDSKIKVTLPYELKAGESPNSIRVVCLSGEAPEYFKATYDQASKTVSFYTSHCSLFAVVPAESGSSSDGGMDTMLIVGIVIAIAAVAGVAAYFLVIKKKA